MKKRVICVVCGKPGLYIGRGQPEEPMHVKCSDGTAKTLLRESAS